MIVLSIITYIEEWIDIFDIFHLNFYLVGILTIIMIVHAVVHNGISTSSRRDDHFIPLVEIFPFGKN